MAGEEGGREEGEVSSSPTWPLHSYILALCLWNNPHMLVQRVTLFQNSSNLYGANRVLPTRTVPAGGPPTL
jgi:hypothetical protein